MSKKQETQTKKSERSESKLYVQSLLAQGKHTRPQIIDKYLAKYPTRAKTTVGTYLSDSKNPRYSAFPWMVVQGKDGVLSFNKKAPVVRPN